MVRFRACKKMCSASRRPGRPTVCVCVCVCVCARARACECVIHNKGGRSRASSARRAGRRAPFSVPAPRSGGDIPASTAASPTHLLPPPRSGAQVPGELVVCAGRGGAGRAGRGARARVVRNSPRALARDQAARGSAPIPHPPPPIPLDDSVCVCVSVCQCVSVCIHVP